MLAADRAGNFRAEILEYGLYEADSGAVAITIRVKLLEFWEDGQWIPWEEYDMEAHGNLWIVKKDGSLNSKSVESVMRYTGWDGNIESVALATWMPLRCQVVLNEETYKDETSFKVSFVNGYDSSPGRSGNVSPDKAKQLAGKYGTQLKALFGNVKKAAPPTGTRPAAPPSKLPGVDPQQQARANKAMAEAAANGDEPDVPF